MPKSEFLSVRNTDVWYLNRTIFKTELAQTVLGFQGPQIILYKTVQASVFGLVRSVFRQCLNTKPFGNRTKGTCPNTELVRYSDVHCTYCIFKAGQLRKLTVSPFKSNLCPKTVNKMQSNWLGLVFPSSIQIVVRPRDSMSNKIYAILGINSCQPDNLIKTSM